MKEQKTLNYTALYLCAFFFLIYGAQVFFGLELAYRPGVEYYRFFTSFFAHSGLEHLLNNIFFLGLFGTIFTIHTDSKTFLTTFFISAVLANLTSFVFYPDTFILGASAGAMGVLAALAIYRPKQTGIGLGVPMPMWAVLISYIFIDLVGLGGTNTTANEAHLAGLFVGAITGYSLRDREYNLKKSYGKKREQREEKIESDDLEIDNWEQRIRRWEEKWMK
ncbi:MAG: rhomboid family intramembrane serine protease [Candidatus Nanohaloarchaea archaeon]